MPNLKSNNILFLFKILSILLPIVLLTNCMSKSFDEEESLLVYLNDESNGYSYSKNINSYRYILLYRPTDLMTKIELNKTVKEKKSVDSLRKKYNQYIYLSLSMSKNNKELLSVVPKNRQDFGVMSKQLTFDMRDKVHLFTQNKDTIDLVDFVYPKMYGMSNSTDILFVYPRNSKYLKGEYLNFSIEDLGFYTGEVKFKISLKHINNEPKLKL